VCDLRKAKVGRKKEEIKISIKKYHHDKKGQTCAILCGGSFMEILKINLWLCDRVKKLLSARERSKENFLKALKIF
jgi:hypothetical protein